MRSNLKRVFQAMFMVLATVMLLSIPASAASSKTVATIGKKSYTSLEAAVKKVKKGQTIKLKKNVKLSSPLQLNRNVKYTINLNGHKITGKNSNRGTLYVKKGTVTLKNGTVDCWIKVYKNASLTTSSIKMPIKNDAYVYVQKKGKLTIKSGTYYDIINYGTLSIKNGTFKYNKPCGKIDNFGTMTITNGTFKGAITNSKPGKATISGGTFNLTDLGFDNCTGATMKISGGTFNSESSLSDVIKNSGTMTFSGGKINMKCGVHNGEGGTLTISGGTITNSRTGGSDITSAVENFGTFKMTGGTLKVSSSLGYALDNFGTAKISGGTLISKQVYKVRNIDGTLNYDKSVLSKNQIDDSLSN